MAKKRYEIKEYKIVWDYRNKCIKKYPLKDKNKRLIKERKNDKWIIIDPYLRVSEYTEKFVAERKGAKKKQGYVKMHPAFKGNEGLREKETAEWFAEEFGWDVIVDKENTRGTDKSYIDLFNGTRWWDEKSPITLNGIQNRLKHGLYQLASVPAKTRGGIVINLDKKNSNLFENLSDDLIYERVINAINEYSRVDCYVIVRKDGKLKKVFMVRHK